VKISETLIRWYQHNKRDLPWRKTKDPYAIWVSEIILQQTRVSQGIDYYRRFMHLFPDLESLAGATIEEVLKAWQGLGYYSRARNLHAAAIQIVHVHGGRFPSNYRELMGLKGIGTYTAAAIASIAFNEPRAVIDGNVHRVIARLFGLSDPPGRRGPGAISRQAAELLDEASPGTYNQAIMEFGALVCTPVNPSCVSCPLQECCIAYRCGQVDELPVKGKNIRQRHRYFHYLIIRTGDRILVRQREKRDIWQHLFEFPLIETSRPTSPARLMESPSWNQLFMSREVRPARVSGTIRHMLTHQVIHARFYHLDNLPSGLVPGLPFREVPFTDISQLPVPKLIENYLDRLID
jgi:A/G-specific adenine glycosylase